MTEFINTFPLDVDYDSVLENFEQAKSRLPGSSGTKVLVSKKALSISRLSTSLEFGRRHAGSRKFDLRVAKASRLHPEE